MSSGRPAKTNRIRKVARSFKGKLSSLLHLSRAPTPSSIEMDSSSDKPTSISPLFVATVPVFGVDHAPTTITSSERPPETNRIRKIARSFKKKLSSLHFSRAFTPSSIEMDSSSDNPTSISPLNTVPVVSVDHAPTTIISNERSPETKRIRKIARSFKRKLSSLLHLSQAPSSIEMDSTSDKPTSISPLNMVPVAGVDHAPTTAYATEAYSGRGLETPPTHMSSATHSPLSPSLPDAIMPFRESEQNVSIQDSSLGLFANARNILITGGTFNNILPANTIEERHMKIQKVHCCRTERCTRQALEDFYSFSGEQICLDIFFFPPLMPN